MLSSIINGGPSPSLSINGNGNGNGSASSSALGITPTADGARQDEPTLDDIVVVSASNPARPVRKPRKSGSPLKPSLRSATTPTLLSTSPISRTRSIAPDVETSVSMSGAADTDASLPASSSLTTNPPSSGSTVRPGSLKPREEEDVEMVGEDDEEGGADGRGPDVAGEGVDDDVDEDEEGVEGEIGEEGADDSEEEEAEEEEGEGEGEGEDDEDEEEEEEEEDDDESSGEESEDLEGTPDIEITGVSGPEGAVDLSLPADLKTVKPEPTSPNAATVVPATDGTETAQGEPAENVLVPKKKRKPKRALSEDEDLPPPPPPMQTLRLERPLVPSDDTMEWNILDDARERGLMPWTIGEPDEKETVQPLGPAPTGEEAMADGDGPPAEPFGAGGLFNMDEDLSPEEIARRLEEKYDKPKKKSKVVKRRAADHAYDLEDPFIDDSELNIDAPTHYARPKKEGFFVHMGEVELMEESPVKPKARGTKKPRASGPAVVKPVRKSIWTITRELHKPKGEGSRRSPIKIDSDDEGEAGAGPSRTTPTPRGEAAEEPPLVWDPQPLDRSLYKNASRDPHYLPPFLLFPDELRRDLRALREASDRHSWSAGQRGKFPDNLRPPLRKVGQTAFQYDLFTFEVREGKDISPFFESLPSVLPYNKFTLTKLVTKMCFDAYWEWLNLVEKTGLEVLTDLVDQEKGQWIEKHEKEMEQWRIQVAEWDEKHPNAPKGEAGAVPTSAAPAGIIDLTEGPNEEGEGDVAAAATGDDRPKEPRKMFTWSAEMRDVFSELSDVKDKMVQLNAKGSEWSVSSAKDPGKAEGKAMGERLMVQTLYKKVISCFPEGYASSNTVSRETSKIKKRNAQTTEA